MSHPDKCGFPIINLAEDEQAQIDSTGLTPLQIAHERVIRKVFTKYEILINICDKIRATFKTKLWRMGKTLSQLGGTKCRQQLQKWQNEDSVWLFEVNTVQEITQLVRQKREAEEELTELVCQKRQAKEQLGNEVRKCYKLQTEVEELKSEAVFLYKFNTKQEKIII